MRLLVWGGFDVRDFFWPCSFLLSSAVTFLAGEILGTANWPMGFAEGGRRLTNGYAKLLDYIEPMAHCMQQNKEIIYTLLYNSCVR